MRRMNNILLYASSQQETQQSLSLHQAIAIHDSLSDAPDVDNNNPNQLISTDDEKSYTKVTRVLRLLKENYTRKAIMRLAQLNHSTSLSEEEQFNQLQKLHPKRNSTSCLPSLPESATDICVGINTVQKLIIQQANGSAPSHFTDISH